MTVAPISPWVDSHTRVLLATTAFRASAIGCSMKSA